MQLSRDTPAVVLAYRFHDDIARTDEIVSRNGIRHPLFAPAAKEVLISI